MSQPNSKRQSHTGPWQVVLDVPHHETIERLVEFITAVRGPDCEADGTGCVVHDVIVLVGTGEAKHSEGPIGLGNTGLISVRPIPAPRTRVDETKPIVVEGSHGPDLIHRIIRTHRITLGSCLKLGADEPARKEQVPIRFVIAADGRVPTATVEPSSPAAGGFPSPATARR